MTSQVVWHGSPQESHDLVNALARNCGCTFGVMGIQLTTCQAHEAMAHDQHFLDHLLFCRRMRERLLSEEFGPQKPAEHLPPYRCGPFGEAD